jgi:hypothetical protein
VECSYPAGHIPSRRQDEAGEAAFSFHHLMTLNDYRDTSEVGLGSDAGVSRTASESMLSSADLMKRLIASSGRPR